MVVRYGIQVDKQVNATKSRNGPTHIWQLISFQTEKTIQ